MATSPGVRVLDVPSDASERDIKVYFSNPRHGGSKIKKIYYPLQSNDAVVLFEDDQVNPKIFQQDHELRGRKIKVRPLQRQVFSKVTVELCPSITMLLDNDPKFLDDIQYDGELEVTAEDNYTMTGDWYQIEWAWQYLDDVCRKDGEGKPLLANGDDGHRRVPNDDDGGSLEASGGTQGEILNPLHYPYHTEPKGLDDFQSYSYERWQNADDSDQNPFEMGGANDLMGAMLGGRLGMPPPSWLQSTGMTHRNQQSGLSLSHDDFKDIPLTFDFNVSTLKVSVLMNDILKEGADAIVTSASQKLSLKQGLSRIIARAAGEKLKTECREYIEQHGNLNIGDVIHTSAGGELDKKVGFVIHAVSPPWQEDNKEEATHLLTCTYINVFQYANSHMWLKSIAMPLIGTGIVGFPLDVCVQAFYDALLLYVMDPDSTKHLQEIRLVSNDADSTCSTVVVLRSLQDIDQISTQAAAQDRYLHRCDEFGFKAKNFVLLGGERKMSVDDEESNDENEETLPEIKTQPVLIGTEQRDVVCTKHGDDDAVGMLASRSNVSFTKINNESSEKPENVSLTKNNPSTEIKVDDGDSSDGSIPFGLVESDDEDVPKPVRAMESLKSMDHDMTTTQEAPRARTIVNDDVEGVEPSDKYESRSDGDGLLTESEDSMIQKTGDKYDGTETKMDETYIHQGFNEMRENEGLKSSFYGSTSNGTVASGSGKRTLFEGVDGAVVSEEEVLTADDRSEDCALPETRTTKIVDNSEETVDDFDDDVD